LMWLGIDPGQQGGLALISGDLAEAVVMPLHPKEDQKTWGGPISWMDVFLTLKGWMKPGVQCVIEKSQAMPKQGVSSTFKYGQNYGGLLTILQVLKIPYTLVRPSTWKPKMFGEDTEGKGSAIRYCEDRWPNLSLLRTKRCTTSHDGMADALCLAAYGEML
jgi:crossover junction endodeoxyribonuclease RuvC